MSGVCPASGNSKDKKKEHNRNFLSCEFEWKK